MAFKKGKSGNPMGRPKGAKNKLTVLRQAVLEGSEEFVLENWQTIVEKTVDLAEKGDTTALKILWDRMVPSTKAIDAAKSATKGGVTIVVQGTPQFKTEEPVEAQYEEVTEDGDQETVSDSPGKSS